MKSTLAKMTNTEIEPDSVPTKSFRVSGLKVKAVAAVGMYWQILGQYFPLSRRNQTRTVLKEKGQSVRIDIQINDQSISFLPVFTDSDHSILSCNDHSAIDFIREIIEIVD
jgi:hypothetical protein